MWSPYTNKSYKARIQKAKKRIYNVPGRPDIVYNVYEDSYAEINEDGIVVTGVAGESALKKYNVTPERLGYEPIEVDTVETGAVFCGTQIPVDKVFTLETDYGFKVVLKGDRHGIDTAREIMCNRQIIPRLEKPETVFM